MSGDYYSDRVRGPRDRGNDEITPAVWGGIVALVERGVAYPWFGKDFPLMCEDGEAVCGCDLRAFGLSLAAEIPELDWPFNDRSLPPTLAALDLLEFTYRHTSAPRQRSYHSYYSHHHLTFKVAEGKAEMRENINRLLARGGMAYELDKDGHVQHLSSPAVEEQLATELPSTGDGKLDDLLQSAIEKFRSRDIRVRREALEPLWDAFERSKTMLRSDKKKGVRALISVATAGADPREATLLEQEMRQLTEIGNEFHIRHHETTKAELNDKLSEQLLPGCMPLSIEFTTPFARRNRARGQVRCRFSSWSSRRSPSASAFTYATDFRFHLVVVTQHVVPTRQAEPRAACGQGSRVFS